MALYAAIRSRFQHQTLSDVSCGPSLLEANALHDATGRYPAIVSLNASAPSAVADSVAYWNRGGVPLLTWHRSAPAAVADAASPEYASFIHDLDAVADALRSLQQRGVAVLWRPLLGHAGDAAKAIWTTVYTRLFVHNRLTNLVWVWSGDAAAFPGTASVDVIAVEGGDGHGSRAAEFQLAHDIAGGKRLVALVAARRPRRGCGRTVRSGPSSSVRSLELKTTSGRPRWRIRSSSISQECPGGRCKPFG
jgi:hypothetical protein